MAVGSNVAFALRSIMKVNLPTKVKVRNDFFSFYSSVTLYLITFKLMCCLSRATLCICICINFKILCILLFLFYFIAIQL
jgi:hypothetical protein